MPTRYVTRQAYDEALNLLYVEYNDGTVQRYNLEEIQSSPPYTPLIDRAPAEDRFTSSWLGRWKDGAIDWSELEFSINPDANRLFEMSDLFEHSPSGSSSGQNQTKTEPNDENISAEGIFELIDEIVSEGGFSDGV